MGLDSAFLFQPWVMTGLWVLIFSSDWLMDWWGARLYYRQVRHFCLFENGYNLKAFSSEDLARPAWIFLRFCSELLITATVLWLTLYSCRLVASWKFYELFCGCALLLEACIHFRHVRNVTLFSQAKSGCGMYGSLAIPRWITLRNAFIEFGMFGIAFLIIYCFDERNYFVLGGVLGCFLAILYNFSVSERERRSFFRTNPTAAADTMTRLAQAKCGANGADGGLSSS